MRNLKIVVPLTLFLLVVFGWGANSVLNQISFNPLSMLAGLPPIAPSGPPEITSIGPSALTNGSWSSDATPTFELVLMDVPLSLIGFRIQIDDTSNFSSPVVDYSSERNSATSKTFTVGQASGGGVGYAVGSAGQTLPDGAYYWRVLGFNLENSNWTIANSGQVAFGVDTGAPTSITPVFSLVTTNSITATTTAADVALAATPFTYHETNSNTYSQTTSDPWTLSDLSPNTSYAIEVGVVDVLGNRATSSIVSVTTLANSPAGLTLSADSATQIAASWTANSNPAGTEYYIENVSAGTNSGWLTSTNWVSSGLTAATAYNFSVKARNSASVETEAVTGSKTTSSAPVLIGSSLGVIRRPPPVSPFGIDPVSVTTLALTPSSDPLELPVAPENFSSGELGRDSSSGPPPIVSSPNVSRDIVFSANAIIEAISPRMNQNSDSSNQSLAPIYIQLVSTIREILDFLVRGN